MMNTQTDLEAALIDQQLTGLIRKSPDWFEALDADRQRSRAFVLLCLARALDLDFEEAFNALTDGPEDAGIDGLIIGDVIDGEFTVTIVQAKYKRKLDGSAHFPANAIELIANSCSYIFDPNVKSAFNPALTPKIEEIRSLIAEGYIPSIRIILCNNGNGWNADGQKIIERTQNRYPGSICFEHFNHKNLIQILRKTQAVDAKLQLSGKMIVEDQEFKRILIGKAHVREFVKLYRDHGDLLLQRNIRRFLGIKDNRVNDAIQQTLNSDKASEFYFYNNGITAICQSFSYNALQEANHVVNVKNLQIINGGQTCRTIFETLKDIPEEEMPNAYLLLRIYQADEDAEDFVQAVTFATNSQNPVELRDLHANDVIQKDLEIGCQALGYVYKRQRDTGFASGAKILHPSTVAEAVLSVWRKKPHQGRFFRRQHFGKLYDEIFTKLTASQAILATLIWKDVENRRRQSDEKQKTARPIFLPYASNYLAMLIGEFLMADLKMDVEHLDHQKFADAFKLWEEKKDLYYATALERIDKAIVRLYASRQVGLQQISAAFRRGDLLAFI